MELTFSPLILLLSFHNPRVNSADILPVNGIPKLVIANEAVTAWLLSILLIPGICVLKFARVVIAPSDTV
jgi:hypothetical protein